jgi:preprotein translocase subunit SecE
MQGPAVRLRAEDPLRIQENPCVRKGEVMADSNKAAADKAKKARTKKKGSWSKGLKTEWDKIVWTDRKTLLKQTGSVVGVSVVLCLLITLIDNLGLQLIQLVIG